MNSSVRASTGPPGGRRLWCARRDEDRDPQRGLLDSRADCEEDYYSKPGEARGIWTGALADQFGLAGDVDTAIT
jgi:hypothetical protein